MSMQLLSLQPSLTIPWKPCDPLDSPKTFQSFSNRAYSQLYIVCTAKKRGRETKHQNMHQVEPVSSYLNIVRHLQQNVAFGVNVFHRVATCSRIGHVHILGSYFEIFPTFNEYHL